MLLGLESFSYHLAFGYGKMDIFDFIRKTVEFGLDGVEINVEGDDLAHLGSEDPGFLAEVRALTEAHDLYVELDTRDTNPQNLTRVLKICNALGAGRMRVFSSMGGDVQAELGQAVKDFRQVLPLCTDYGIKIAYENHEFETSHDVLKVVREVDSEYVGTHVDTGNSMMVWEDPIEAICRIVHDHGGQVYMDGANMNALLGRVKLGDLGFDVVHGDLDNPETYQRIAVKNASMIAATLPWLMPALRS